MTTTQGRRDIGAISIRGYGMDSHTGYSLIYRLVRQTQAETFVSNLSKKEYLENPPKNDAILFGSGP